MKTLVKNAKAFNLKVCQKGIIRCFNTIAIIEKLTVTTSNT